MALSSYKEELDMMNAPYNYYGPMSSGDWGFSLIMMIVWPLVIIVIVMLAVKAFRTANEDHRRANHQDPLDTIKDRYARGDITKDQYEQLKKDLK